MKMPRGQGANIGDERISANGYHYTRTESGWRLTHHIVAEQTLGRPLNDDERVTFKDKKRTNLSPENVVVILQGKTSLRRRKANVEARIEELKAELAYINNELINGNPR
jgi:argininosuccinate lyase